MARYTVLCCGRRWGKTTLIVNLLVERLLKGQRVAYISPTHSDNAALSTWGRFKTTLAPITVKKLESPVRTIEIAGGGNLSFWSFEAIDRFRGDLDGYDYVAIDECAFIPNLQEEWQEAIRPTLMDRRGGAIFASTPKGINDFHQLYMKSLKGEADWGSFTYKTLDNPHIPPDEIEAARAGMLQMAFLQEIEAQFISSGGAVFRGLDNVQRDEPPAPYEGNFVMGVDWGKENDYTVMTIIDTHTRQQVAIDRFNQVGWQIQRDRLATVAAAWGVHTIYAESNSIGSPNIEALQADGLNVIPFTTTAQSKRAVIEALALAIERRDIMLLDNDVQHHELLAYTMKKTSAGNYIYGAPAGAHDDTVMALAIAWHGVQNAPVDMRILMF